MRLKSQGLGKSLISQILFSGFDESPRRRGGLDRQVILILVNRNPLSKSQYTKGLTCLKKLWLYRERRELATPPSEVQDAIFTQGHEVGKLAHKLFPNGVLIEEDHTDPAGALASTKSAMSSGAEAIFEAAFQFEDILVRTDILSKNSDGTWELVEVKSSTKVKNEHLPDVAIQKFVLIKFGLPLGRSCLLHLNSEYVRNGDIFPPKLFTLAHVDEKIGDEYSQIERHLAVIRATVKVPNEPEVRLSSACKNPHPCEFKEYCWKQTAPESIHFLGRIGDKKRGQLLDQNIELIEHIPKDFELTEAQKIEHLCHLKRSAHVDKAKIEEHLSQLTWPLYFLDFEAVGYAIPEYEGTRPYEALAFQYSLHIQREPGGALEHREFLHKEDSDPRTAVANQLVRDIGPTGSVVAYHASYEKGRIEEMIERCPEIASELQGLIKRIWDLETPFTKRWYWDHRFQGSSSIKKVLPVLVPAMSYENLGIQRGDEAQLQYQRFLKLPADSSDRETIRKNLLSYCEQDSLAMARLLDALQKI